MWCSPLGWNSAHTVAAHPAWLTLGVILGRASDQMLSVATNSSLTPCALRSNLSNCSTFSAFFASAAVPHETCPFDTDSEGRKPKSGHPKLGNNEGYTQQKQCVWVLQHNGVLIHRLYKPLDAHAQTYGPQNTNKKYKIWTLFQNELMPIICHFLPLSRQVFAIERSIAYIS